jgi:hypothetical protein
MHGFIHSGPLRGEFLNIGLLLPGLMRQPAFPRLLPEEHAT